MLGQFQQYPIIPKHIWESHTGNKGNDLKTFPNNAPIVGAGPFTLDEFKKDQIALFQRYDGFYGPKAKVDAFGLRMFSNDDALVAALKAHEIDAIEEVPPTAIDTLKKAGFDVTDVPGTDQTDFIINSSPNKKSHPELQNLQVRMPSTTPSTASGSSTSSSSGPRSRRPRSSRARPETGPIRASSRPRSTSTRRTRSSTGSATRRAATESASRTARRCPTR